MLLALTVAEAAVFITGPPLRASEIDDRIASAAQEAQRDLTTEYAKDVEGVTTVHNEMTVSKTSKMPDATMGEKIDDASITALVKMTLLFHRSIGGIVLLVTGSKKG